MGDFEASSHFMLISAPPAVIHVSRTTMGLVVDQIQKSVGPLLWSVKCAYIPIHNYHQQLFLFLFKLYNI